MTAIPSVRVLGPGTTEAQEHSIENETNSESISHDGQEVQGSLAMPDRQTEQPSHRNTPAESAADYHHIAIGSLLDTRLRMRGTLTLEIEQEGEFYIAKCDELNEFGYDYDPIGAVQDVRVSIAELYWELKENQHRLGADLTETWRRLSELVYEA